MRLKVKQLREELHANKGETSLSFYFSKFQYAMVLKCPVKQNLFFEIRICLWRANRQTWILYTIFFNNSRLTDFSWGNKNRINLSWIQMLGSSWFFSKQTLILFLWIPFVLADTNWFLLTFSFHLFLWHEIMIGFCWTFSCWDVLINKENEIFFSFRQWVLPHCNVSDGNPLRNYASVE